MVRRIQFAVDDEKFDRLKKAKGDRTWLEMLEDGAEVDDV